MAATDLDTLVGHVNFDGNGPHKNICNTPIFGGQWVKRARSGPMT